MPAVRTNRHCASHADTSPSPLPYPNDFTFGSAVPEIQLVSHTASYYNSSPPPAAKKKRSHGKARPPGHIPRPPNPFIIFRTETIKAMATHSTPEMSKNLGVQWKTMSAIEKRPWIEKARIAKEEHMKQYPDYKYKPVHPRDANGKCIRKQRKQKQPRVITVAAADPVDHLSGSFTWMEGKSDAECSGISLPSNCSSASSPFRSPSPEPSVSYPQPSHLSQRRSSSVPLPSSDERFFFGISPQGGDPTFPPSPNSHHTGHVSRWLSRRPSTSMDFACAGPTHAPEFHVQSNGYLAPPGDYLPWRPNHRRSISAPMFNGDIQTAQFMQAPAQECPQTPNALTPINPEFSAVFDKFSWTPTATAQHPTIMSSQPTYTGLEIPSMTHSPLSNGSNTPPLSSPSHTPVIQHPAPISTFDFSAFQAQIGDFDPAPQVDARYTPVSQDSIGNALGFVPQSYQAAQVHPEDMGQIQGRDQQFYPVEQQQGLGNASTVQYSEGGQIPSVVPQSPYSHTADMNSYEEGLRYTQSSHSLDFNELIVEGYQ